jgi:hypothetical protein
MTLHLLSQAGVFIYSSRGKWVFPLLLWSFPPSTIFTSFPAFPLLIVGYVLLLLLARVFVYSSHGRWVIPPLLWSFPPSTNLTGFPTPGCWVCAPALALSGQAQIVYLQFRKGFPSAPLQCSGHPTLFAMCLYCAYCLLLSFSFFAGWGSIMLIWPRVVCGSTAYHLAHLVRVFPSCLGAGVWWLGGPPGFSVSA